MTWQAVCISHEQAGSRYGNPMEIQCSAIPFVFQTAPGSLCTEGRVKCTHTHYTRRLLSSGVKPRSWFRANRPCLPHSQIMLAGLYPPHYCTALHCPQVPGYMGAVNLGDTSHRAQSTKVLTCTLVSPMVATNTSASQNVIELCFVIFYLAKGQFIMWFKE